MRQGEGGMQSARCRLTAGCQPGRGATWHCRGVFVGRAGRGTLSEACGGRHRGGERCAGAAGVAGWDVRLGHAVAGAAGASAAQARGT